MASTTDNTTTTSKVFLITGSSRGLGRDLVRAALAAGHRVVATARDPRTLEEFTSSHDASKLIAVALDVTDYAAGEAAVARAVEAFGRLDVLVNNAGYADVAAVEDVTLEDFRAQIETNLFGVVNLSKAALPVMRAQGKGHIIQISSVGGRLATPGLGAYQTAKWAVGGFSEVLAKEVTPLGINVTVVEPGGMATDWAGSSMKVPPVSAPYAPTVGATAARMHGGTNWAAGDPVKVAQLVMRVAAEASPPLRIMAGTDAYTYATAAAQARLASDAQWRELSCSTDRDGISEAQKDPLNRAGRAAEGAAPAADK